MIKTQRKDFISVEDTFAFQMTGFHASIQLLILWLLLPQTVSVAHPALCTMNDTLQASHQYSQPGDLLIGGITSQFFPIYQSVSFEKHPKGNLFNETLYENCLYIFILRMN